MKPHRPLLGDKNSIKELNGRVAVSVKVKRGGECIVHYRLRIWKIFLGFVFYFALWILRNSWKMKTEIKSSKAKSQSKSLFLDDSDFSAALCEFDAVIEDFSSPVHKRRFRYDEHLQTMKRRSSASVSDSGISDSDSGECLYRNSFSFSDEKLNSPAIYSPTLASPAVTSPRAKLGDTKELEDFIADLDRTLANM